MKSCPFIITDITNCLINSTTIKTCFTITRNSSLKNVTSFKIGFNCLPSTTFSNTETTYPSTICVENSISVNINIYKIRICLFDSNKNMVGCKKLKITQAIPECCICTDCNISSCRPQIPQGFTISANGNNSLGCFDIIPTIYNNDTSIIFTFTPIIDWGDCATPSEIIITASTGFCSGPINTFTISSNNVDDTTDTLTYNINRPICFSTWNYVISATNSNGCATNLGGGQFDVINLNCGV